MTFQTVSSLLSCPMCDTPKKKAAVIPSSDSFVSMYAGAPEAASGVSGQKLASISPASHLAYGKPAYRWAGAMPAQDPYPTHY